MNSVITTKRLRDLKILFRDAYNIEPVVCISSTGRLEIIGNHVDHNGGICLVSSVANLNIVSWCKREVGHINIKSKGFKMISVDINDTEYCKEEEGTSTSFVKGIVAKFRELGLNVGGFNACVDSNIFRGAGVSSSAAYCCLICKILSYFYNDDKVDTVTIAKVSRYAENAYFGKNSGLLDQIGCCSKGFSLVDFKDQENPVITQVVPDFKDYDLVLINTLTDHSDCSEAYGSIPADYKKVATQLGATFLRDADFKKFNELFLKDDNKDKIEFKRAKHFFDENGRVINAFLDIKENDVKKFLNEINESGLSSELLLQNILIPGEETNNLLEGLHLARSFIKDGAVRVHGGGFGGTILTFINKKDTQDYIKFMGKKFGENNILIVYPCENPLRIVEILNANTKR